MFLEFGGVQRRYEPAMPHLQRHLGHAHDPRRRFQMADVAIIDTPSLWNVMARTPCSGAPLRIWLSNTQRGGTHSLSGDQSTSSMIWIPKRAGSFPKADRRGMFTNEVLQRKTSSG